MRGKTTPQEGREKNQPQRERGGKTNHRICRFVDPQTLHIGGYVSVDQDIFTLLVVPPSRSRNRPLSGGVGSGGGR